MQWQKSPVSSGCGSQKPPQAVLHGTDRGAVLWKRLRELEQEYEQQRVGTGIISIDARRPRSKRVGRLAVLADEPVAFTVHWLKHPPRASFSILGAQESSDPDVRELVLDPGWRTSRTGWTAEQRPKDQILRFEIATPDGVRLRRPIWQR